MGRLQAAVGRKVVGTMSGRASIALVIAGLVAACGGSSPNGTQGPAATSGPGPGATATQAVDPTEDTGGGGGNGGGGNFDAETVANALVPPNSKEVTRTTTDDYWFVMYESTDSIDSLKSFYEGAIARTGLKIISTTTVNDGVSWAIANDDSGSFGGAVQIFPSGDGKTAVQVAVGRS